MAALASHKIDRLNGTTLTTDRLLTDTGWDSDWIAGGLIFDSGAGAGRFRRIGSNGCAGGVAGYGIAIDAVETTRVHGDAVQCIQASLYAMPLRSAAFDAVHCAGVIQHTPEAERTMRAMPRLLNRRSARIQFLRTDMEPASTTASRGISPVYAVHVAACPA